MPRPESAGALLVRQLFDEAFNRRELGVLEHVVASEYVEHALAPFETDEPGVVNGPRHMRGVIEWLLAQYADLRMDVVALVSDRDVVAVRVLSEGTNTGRINGVVPPTNRRFRAEQCHWYRVDHGRLAEHWAVRDDLRTMQQLGLIARPEPVR